MTASSLDWERYEQLRQALLRSPDFTPDRHTQHRLEFRKHHKVDLIPFGAIERSDRTIVWPPPGNAVMRTLGFREAMTDSLQVRLPFDQRVAVVSLPAFALLKFLAWNDRRDEQPRKDAGDIGLAIRHYLDAGNADRLYQDSLHLLDDPAFDLERAGAWLLGVDVRKLLLLGGDPRPAIAVVEAILEPEISPDGPMRLASDMSTTGAEMNLRLLQALHAGFSGRQRP